MVDLPGVDLGGLLFGVEGRHGGEFPLTDLENELRDRSYALIRPNEPRGNWNLYIAGFQIAHLLPPSMTDYDHTEYARMLLSTPARSEVSSYNRLIDDMANEGMLIGPFIAVACAVADLDRKRVRSLAYVGELNESEAGNAFGRVRENGMVTAWVRRALYWRLGSYRYALERLVIAVPSGLAVAAERALKRFDAQVQQADAPFVRIGDKAELSDASAPERKKVATVTRMTGELDQKTRTMLIEVHLDNSDDFFVPGSFVYVTLTVPIESVTRIDRLSLSARMIAPVAGRMFGQWPELTEHTAGQVGFAGNVLGQG